jgi:DNA polymerase elongation subunit (family B)
MSTKVSPEAIEAFFAGTNPLKYVVNIEGNYDDNHVQVIINDPIKGKEIVEARYYPFLWMKKEANLLLYDNKNDKKTAAKEKYGIKILHLTTANSEGYTPPRLSNGYKYLVKTNKTFRDLVMFFNQGGIDIYDKTFSSLFLVFSPVEQYMIQSGVRLFKGFEDYNDLHRFQFDLETEGLSGQDSGIFLFGLRDNRGFETVLEVKGNTALEKRQSEKENIQHFFNIINHLKPDIVAGYNSEAFDWKFILDRAQRLGMNINAFAKGLDGETIIKRKPAMLKLGNEMESFEQTILWGHNIIDIAHSVRRAQAINSSIKSWSLKYITKYSEIAKKNRVYVKGNKIHSLWDDNENKYAFDDTNGDWYKISDLLPLKEGYEEVTGAYIIERYLLDDLWETEQIDVIFNQAAFLISKLLPTTYNRSTTMGTASQWKLLMAAWSYQNNLAIPETEPKTKFTGGLSRLLSVGYAKNVVKLDYAALYPKTELTHDIFPDLDISGVMKGMLTYIVDTRDKFKFLTEKFKNEAKELQKKIDESKNLSNEELAELKEELKKVKAQKNLYDKKQLPLKILANSWFGAYGAPYIFNWGETNCAEETTCRGRQYLRLMVKHFTEKYGFKPLVGDTDGFNFEFPENINEIKYVARGSHWKTTENAGKELTGLDAVLAEFNENYMIGRMGLDIDEICNSTINFSRKNYANDIEGKIKYVGNSIKSKKMPEYIEDFLHVGIRLLLDGKGKEFIEYYYSYVDKLYNFNIPLVKIASKSKIKQSVSDYKARMLKKNKAGRDLSPMVHMELVMLNNLNVGLGDTVYYYNIGKSKNDRDASMVKDKEGNKVKVINCKLLTQADVETNLEYIKEIDSLNALLKKIPSDNVDKINEIQLKINEYTSYLITDEYNVVKYLQALNSKVEPLLVCFHPDIRSKILITLKKDRKTKVEKLSERNFFTDAECKLVSGMPDEPTDQDSYAEDLMKMEDKEIRFWERVNKIPNNMEPDEWDRILKDYHERMITLKATEIEEEKQKFINFTKKMEVADYEEIEESKNLPKELSVFLELKSDFKFYSKKYEIEIAAAEDLFKYKTIAEQRDEWYEENNVRDKKKKYEIWLKKNENIFDTVIESESSVIDLKSEDSDEEIIKVSTDDDDDDEWNF